MEENNDQEQRSQSYSSVDSNALGSLMAIVAAILFLLLFG